MQYEVIKFDVGGKRSYVIKVNDGEIKFYKFSNFKRVYPNAAGQVLKDIPTIKFSN